MIRLFDGSATDFTTQGFGVLECVSCDVTENLNGEYELKASVPVTALRFGDLALQRLIVTEPNPVDEPQAFRIYKITKPLGGVVEVYAEHISYDLSGVPILPFTASSCADVFDGFADHAAIEHPFEFDTDIETQAEYKIEVPSSCRSILAGGKDSLLDVFGGEYKFDNFSVSLLTARGAARGVVFRYGKNLTDLKQDEDCADVYTGVVAFYKKDDSVICGDVQDCPGTYQHQRVKIVDASKDFENTPSVSDLNQYAVNYISDNGVGIPKVSLTVGIVQLSKLAEYEAVPVLDEVRLGDTVGVFFRDLNVSASAKVNKIVYDAVAKRITSIAVGDVADTIADTIAKTDVIQGTPGNLLAIGQSGEIVDSGRSSTSNGARKFTVTVAVADWNGQTSAVKTVVGLSAGAVTTINPDYGYKAAVDQFVVDAYVSAADTLTLSCQTVPTAAITLVVVQYS